MISNLFLNNNKYTDAESFNVTGRGLVVIIDCGSENVRFTVGQVLVDDELNEYRIDGFYMSSHLNKQNQLGIRLIEYFRKE